MTEILKPCPFCNGVGEFTIIPLPYSHRVVCGTCGATAGGSAFKNDVYNAQVWNKRANQAGDLMSYEDNYKTDEKGVRWVTLEYASSQIYGSDAENKKIKADYEAKLCTLQGKLDASENDQHLSQMRFYEATKHIAKLEAELNELKTNNEHTNDTFDLMFDNAMVFEEVISELKNATKKYPTWPTDPLHAVAILGEEYGELVKAILQVTYEPHKSSEKDVRMEARQTAASALRLLMSLSRYAYVPSHQHSQKAVEPPSYSSEGDSYIGKSINEL